MIPRRASQRRRVGTRVLLLTTTLALAALSGGVLAQTPVRRAEISFRDGVAHLDLSLADFADERVRRRLESGLPQTLELRAYAHEVGGAAPIAVAVSSCRVVYDLWEEVYRIEMSAGRALTVASVADVVDHCLGVAGLPIGNASSYRDRSGREVYFEVSTLLNPLTPETVHRVRRWLARPGGAADPSETYFGSFVSLFVNRSVGDAEARLDVRTQRVHVP